MANFMLTNTPRPIWTGGPLSNCAVCKFPNAYPWYVVLEGVFHETPNTVLGRDVEETIHLCSDHATELKSVLDDIIPDTRLAKAQAAVLKAEAARAKAEKRADVAEKALAAMQDWMTEADAK